MCVLMYKTSGVGGKREKIIRTRSIKKMKLFTDVCEKLNVAMC